MLVIFQKCGESSVWLNLVFMFMQHISPDCQREANKTNGIHEPTTHGLSVEAARVDLLLSASESSCIYTYK